MLEAQPQGTPRLVVLAHGSLRHADFRDRVAAVARVGFDGLGPELLLAALGEFLRVVRD